ncbi:hypothetical protein GBA52_020231 [Prunus armeniaca]|nr:hypothetical protein GBA52_020231 [Prunus armeniaca]
MIIKALELHPDKRPHDPHTHANFQSLKLSYEMLEDDKARKIESSSTAAAAAIWNVMPSDRTWSLSKRTGTSQRDEEERIARKLKEEIARIHASGRLVLLLFGKQKVAAKFGKESGWG